MSRFRPFCAKKTTHAPLKRNNVCSYRLSYEIIVISLHRLLANIAKIRLLVYRLLECVSYEFTKRASTDWRNNTLWEWTVSLGISFFSWFAPGFDSSLQVFYRYTTPLLLIVSFPSSKYARILLEINMNFSVANWLSMESSGTGHGHSHIGGR